MTVSLLPFLPPLHLPDAAQLYLATILAVLIVGAAKLVRALSWSGAVAAAVVGFLLFGIGGWRGAAALLLFFITSTALSRVGKKQKDALKFEKGGERDAGQVLANGGIAALCALLMAFYPYRAHWLSIGLLGALAAANADTWATELGSLAKRPPFLITNFRPAPTGASGAVSLPGTLAALAGATLIGVLALFWGLGPDGLAIVAVSGLAGALFDSLLGATVQVQYRCPVCGKLTERRIHCDDQPAERARGLRFIGNDLVNFAATTLGAVLAIYLMRLG
jgi:uncharacterized protein (TIGR00297 family)